MCLEEPGKFLCFFVFLFNLLKTNCCTSQSFCILTCKIRVLDQDIKQKNSSGHLEFIVNHFLNVTIPTLGQSESTYVSSCYIPPTLFLKSANAQFLPFILEEKNEDGTFWSSHHAVGNRDSNGRLPGNARNGKHVAIGMETLDFTLPEHVCG